MIITSGKELNEQDIIIKTNNYIVDVVTLFGYTFSVQNKKLFEKIVNIEKDEIPYLYEEEIQKIGVELYNTLFDCKSQIKLNENSSLVIDLF